MTESRLEQAVEYRRTFEDRPGGVLSSAEWTTYRAGEEHVGTVQVADELSQGDLAWLRETFTSYRIRTSHSDRIKVVVDE